MVIEKEVTCLIIPEIKAAKEAMIQALSKDGLLAP